jgi:hypothetical protein
MTPRGILAIAAQGMAAQATLPDSTMAAAKQLHEAQRVPQPATMAAFGRAVRAHPGPDMLTAIRGAAKALAMAPDRATFAAVRRMTVLATAVAQDRDARRGQHAGERRPRPRARRRRAARRAAGPRSGTDPGSDPGEAEPPSRRLTADPSRVEVLV